MLQPTEPPSQGRKVFLKTNNWQQFFLCVIRLMKMSQTVMDVQIRAWDSLNWMTSESPSIPDVLYFRPKALPCFGPLLFFSSIFWLKWNPVGHLLYSLALCLNQPTYLRMNNALRSYSRRQVYPWLVWLSGLSTGPWTKGLLVRFQAWVAGQVMQLGTCERQAINVSLSHQCFSPSLSSSLPLLSK